MSRESAVRVERVQINFEGTVILRDVELNVTQGEIFGLIGPNGVGKSTLINVISGIVSPNSGRVFLNGEDVSHLQPKERARQVAIVPQNPSSAPGFKALDMVLMGRNPHLGLLEWEGHYDLNICQKAMELTNTWQFRDRYVRSLSGGERQLVFIARALVQEASVLLLDEPTAHLDIGFQSEVLELIRQLRSSSGLTVMMAMHDMTLAGQYCDHIALMNKGTVHSIGEPEKVLTSDNIYRVFGADVTIIKHPIHGTPVIVSVGSNVRKVADE